MDAENVSSPSSAAADDMANMKLEPGTEGEMDAAPSYDYTQHLAKETDDDAVGLSFTVLGSPTKQYMVMKEDTTLKTFYDYVMQQNGRSGKDLLSFHLRNQHILTSSPKMSQTLKDLELDPETNMSFDAQASGGKNICILA